MSNIFDMLKARRITVITDGEKTIIGCDVVTEESHEMVSEVTEFEIEDGSLITDHVIKKGKRLKITGLISDDPITILQTGLLERSSSILPTSLKSKLGFGIGGKNSKNAFDQFEKIYDEKRPVEVVTGLKKYDNMIMIDLNMPRSSKTVRSLQFTATFKQINIVSTDFTYAPSQKMEAGLGAEEKKNIGKKGTKTLTGEADNDGVVRGAAKSIYNLAN